MTTSARRLLPARVAATRVAAAVVAAALLSACTSAPVPPLHLHSLGSLAVPMSSPLVTPLATPAAPIWQLLAVQLPAYLDRDALLVPAASGGLQALAGERWAEPLRDALPRLLRDDLARLRGAASVWAAPLPPGLRVQRQLRVELLALDVLPGRSTVRLRARWWLADVDTASTSTPPLLGEADLQASAAGNDATTLVAAHRLLLWQLAQRIVSNTGNAGPH